MNGTGLLPGVAREGPRVETLLDDPARGCRVTYEPGFFAPDEAAAWMERLLRDVDFVAEAPVMFGEPVPVKRRSCGLGEPGTRYRYAGVERVAAPWPEGFGALLERLHERTGARFNFALCNLYPDGGAGLGWHADDEHDLAPDAPIASISLGAERDFAMRLGARGRACVTVALASGSLLVMGGATQRHYQHRVPPRARCAGPRVNLTFRRMRG